MRLPVVPDISTKDGSANKNARLYNALKETKPSGETLAVIRPGLSLSTTYSGLGNGLIVFDGRLLTIVDDTIFDPELADYWPLDSDSWSISTTYSWGDFVWYNGKLWASIVGSNVGNIPAAGTYWSNSYKTPVYVDEDTYDLGQPVSYNGVIYYSYRSSNIDNTPSSSNYWGLTPPTHNWSWILGDYQCLPAGTRSGFGSQSVVEANFAETLNASSACTQQRGHVYEYILPSLGVMAILQDGIEISRFSIGAFPVTISSVPL